MKVTVSFGSQAVLMEVGPTFLPRPLCLSVISGITCEWFDIYCHCLPLELAISSRTGVIIEAKHTKCVEITLILRE
jgi:hypothetical protein